MASQLSRSLHMFFFLLSLFAYLSFAHRVSLVSATREFGNPGINVDRDFIRANDRKTSDAGDQMLHHQRQVQTFKEPDPDKDPIGHPSARVQATNREPDPDEGSNNHPPAHVQAARVRVPDLDGDSNSYTPQHVKVETAREPDPKNDLSNHPSENPQTNTESEPDPDD